MTGAELLRAARRRAGISQRELAVRAGIGASTIAAIEAGTRDPSWAVLAAVCAATELDLALEPAAATPTPAQVAHLRLGLGARLCRALGMDERCPSPRRPPTWTQLQQLASAGVVVLHGDAAVAMWLPLDEPLLRLDVCLRPHQPTAAPDTPNVLAGPACDAHGRAPVAVPAARLLVHVDSPSDLALHASTAAQRSSLRGVARLLHEQAARDPGGRRVHAHRDPDHRAERLRLADTKRYGSLPIPPTTDTRSWRLEDSAGLKEWTRGYGYPD